MEESQKIYIGWGEHTRTLRKLPKIGWGGSKYTKFKNLTAYFQVMKTLLAKKI